MDMDQIILLQDNCPICGSTMVEDHIETNLSTFFFPLPENLIKKAKKEPIKLKICQKCSFIFQVDVKIALIELIYTEFYKHYNLDTSIEFQEVYRERTIKFMKELLPKEIDSKVLDLGCGEGTYFPFFETLGFQCYGIEPSEKAKIAKEKNPKATISSKFFLDLDKNELNIKFDVILMNWVLEHISGLDSFFNKLRIRLKDKAKLVIQVPDIKYYIDNDIPLFYVHEHINYFTIETLRLLLERKGFEIMGEKFGDTPSILICAEYSGKESKKQVNYSELFAIQKSFLLRNNDLKLEIIKLISEYEKIVIYGIGLLAFWIGDLCLNNMDLNKIELIDDNEYYHDKWVPVFNKKIKIFPIGHCFNNTLIIIGTSPVYHDKIIKIINKKYIGNFKIAKIKENVLVIEE